MGGNGLQVVKAWVFLGPRVGGGVNMNKNFLYCVAKMFRFFAWGLTRTNFFQKVFTTWQKRNFFSLGAG